MIVRPFDPVLLALAGVMIAVLVRWHLAALNEDWYPVLLSTVLGLFWGTLLLAGYGVASALPSSDVSPLVAVCYALSYPFWLRLGAHAVFLFVGRRPEEGGLLWIYVIDDYTESFDSSWER